LTFSINRIDRFNIKNVIVKLSIVIIIIWHATTIDDNIRDDILTTYRAYVI